MTELDEKTNVLCFFQYWSTLAGKTLCFDDSVMVHVNFVSEISDAFEAAIDRGRRRGWAVGPPPERWELMHYIPEKPIPLDVGSLH